MPCNAAKQAVTYREPGTETGDLISRPTRTTGRKQTAHVRPPATPLGLSIALCLIRASEKRRVRVCETFRLMRQILRVSVLSKSM